MEAKVPKRKVKTGGKLTPEQKKLSRKQKIALRAKQKAMQEAAAKRKAAKRQQAPDPVKEQQAIMARSIQKKLKKTKAKRQQILRGESKYLLNKYNDLISRGRKSKQMIEESIAAREAADKNIIYWSGVLDQTKKSIQSYYTRIDEFDNGVSNSLAHKDLKEGDKVLWGWKGISDALAGDDPYGVVMHDAKKGQEVKIKQLHRNEETVKLLKENLKESKPEAEELIGEDEPCEEAKPDKENNSRFYGFEEPEGSTAEEAQV